jgi:hypothetical protein
MTWRTGTKNPHTLYLDSGGVSLPQGFIMNPGAARAIVAAMNGKPPVTAGPSRAQLVELQNRLSQLSDEGAVGLLSHTDVALLAWALGYASGREGT